ncbi:Protein Y53G8AR.7 a [Aphelenchoides avenae]|nr:Protein Y53G8AR.7 a [Aphelenchus avenae]
MGVVFPVMNIALLTILSNVLDSQHQSTHQGINMTFGCAGRLVGPILITSLFHSGGPRRAWAAQVLGLVAGLVPWLAFYRRMAPVKSNSNEVPKAAPTPTLDKKFRGICECIRY